MLNKKQLLEMFGSQYDLNCVYNGNEWKQQKFISYFQAAADAEHAEFLTEIEGIWKWYYKHAKNDFPAALFEAIDVLHFNAATILTALAVTGMSKEFSLLKIEEAYDNARANGLLDVDETYDGFEQAYPRLRKHQGVVLDSAFNMSVIYQKEGCWSADRVLMHALVALHQWMVIIGGMINVNGDQIYQAYLKKNARNHERVAKGVMQGVDVKSSEEPLHV